MTKREGGRITAKRRVNIYLDAAIVEHFKKQAGARGYQTLINQTLKTRSIKAAWKRRCVK
ncbi:MAG: BrnA antitoxin family protein [Burkholderiales bacterium]|nr:BrnA antitoxin family protein [Burkholderiales bacterium]